MKPPPPRLLLLCLILATSPTPTHALEVEAQPLKAQVKRVSQALEFLGHPLPASARLQLEKADRMNGDAEVANAVQQILDPLTIGEVIIPESGEIHFIPSEAPPALLEQGWRAFLVKALNERGSTAILRADSPGARPIPESPAEDVEGRWIDIETMDRRPMMSHLSGLPLEYRIVQLWAREAGKHEASIAFTLGAEDGASRVEEVDLKVWNFEEDTEGWMAQNQSTIEAHDGVLKVTTTGGDPFMGAHVHMGPGEKRVRWRAKTETTGMWQVFWWTEGRPFPDGGRQRTTSVFENNGEWGEYQVTIPVEDHLMGIRLDPGAAIGESEIDWIEIGSLVDPGPGWAIAPMTFDVQSAVPVRFEVKDENGDPAVVSFVIRDSEARVYPMQTKRLAPDFFFHPHEFETMFLVERD